MNLDRIKPHVNYYNIIAVASSIVGILSIVYLSVLDISLYIGLGGLDVELTSELNFLDLREQMVKYNQSTTYIDASIALLGVGSLINLIALRFKRAVAIGSLLQISSILLLIYEYNLTADTSSSKVPLVIDPTVWMFAVFALPVITIVVFVAEEANLTSLR